MSNIEPSGSVTKLKKSVNCNARWRTVFNDNHKSWKLGNQGPGSHAWCAKDCNEGEWFILEPRDPNVVGGIVLQGRGDNPQWVTELDIETTRDGFTWKNEGRFLGVSDQNTEHFLYFETPKFCRGIKLCRMKHHSHMSLRVAVLIAV